MLQARFARWKTLHKKMLGDGCTQNAADEMAELESLIATMPARALGDTIAKLELATLCDELPASCFALIQSAISDCQSDSTAAVA